MYPVICLAVLGLINITYMIYDISGYSNVRFNKEKTPSDLAVWWDDNQDDDSKDIFACSTF